MSFDGLGWPVVRIGKIFGSYTEGRVVSFFHYSTFGTTILLS